MSYIDDDGIETYTEDECCGICGMPYIFNPRACDDCDICIDCDPGPDYPDYTEAH